MVVRFHFLGPFDLDDGQQALIKPPTQKSQSLLAYLVFHRKRPQSREHLINLFWGERPEHKARRSLTTALWHIRSCLPDDYIISDYSSVQVNPQAIIWVDVDEFNHLVHSNDSENLVMALNLYHGTLLDGFYDDWIMNERYRIEADYEEALTRLMLMQQDARLYQQALQTALRLVDQDPLREDAHRLVMRAFCRLGQRNAALEQYRHCRQLVQEELGAEPMAETVELYQTILDGRFETGLANARLIASKAHVNTIHRTGQDPLNPIIYGRLVGREQEMTFLRDRYQEVLAGHGTLVLVSGEAGVGKTRLIEEFAHRLRWEGVRVLWGRCYEFERIVPYQPISEALQTVLSTLTPTDLANLPSWILTELARLLPELSERCPGISSGTAVPLDQEQAHFFEAVALFLAGLAEKAPLALILDDLHLAANSTLEMVHFLTRHLAGRAVLIVGTLRPESIGQHRLFQELQRQLSCDDLAWSLNVAGLSPQAVAALILEMSGSGTAIAPLARRLYEETEGNPFFLIETVKSLFEAGLVCMERGAWQGDFEQISQAKLPLPSGVSEAIQTRVSRLGQRVRQALQVASVLGREFDLQLLSAASKRDEEATLEILDVLLRRGFVDEGSGVLGRDYVFHHHKIQEVIYAGLPIRRRQHLHARVGKEIERQYALDAEGVAGELAFHFQEGRLVDKALAPKAVRYLLLAGDQARLVYAHREAIDFYTRALTLQKEQGDHGAAARTLMKLGLTYHIGFEFVQAQRAFQKGFSLWQQLGRRHVTANQPPAPHALRIRWRLPYTLDPALCMEYVSALVISQMFSGLVSIDAELNVVPEVAQHWEVYEDGRRYRFHLRQDAYWSDGKAVTAHDFEYAWKRVLDPATGIIDSDFFAIKGVRAFHQAAVPNTDCIGVQALDDWTLEVELEEAVSHFLYFLANAQFYPVPRHVVMAYGAAWTSAERIVTNGPFLLESWDQGECMRLARNPLYTGRRKGNVQQVLVQSPRETSPCDLSASLALYLGGDLDILTLTDTSVHEADLLRRRFATEYVSAPWLFTVYLGFVTSRPPFDDIRMRQALAQGIDQEALANVILRGMCTPGTGGFVPPGMPGHSRGIGLPFDPNRAYQLLNSAGYAGGSDLYVLEGLSVPPIDPLITKYLRAQWRDSLGIQVGWEVADWPQFERRLHHDPPHLYLLASFANGPDPVNILPAPLEGQFTRWSNQAYDELIEQAGHTFNQGARIALLSQADEFLIHEAPIVPLFYGRQHMLVKPWIRSFPISPLNRWYWKDIIIEAH